jgi:hypothetical protein
VFSAIFNPSCDIIQQAGSLSRLKECEFSINGVNAINLAGIELREGMQSSDLNTGQIMQLANAAFQKNMPLKFNLLVNVNNPNSKAAALSRMDYTLFLDGVELLSGQLNQRFTIESGKSIEIPLPVQVELFKTMSGQSADAVSNLGFKLTGNSNKKVEILFKVKPFIYVGASAIPYPGFIEIKHQI